MNNYTKGVLAAALKYAARGWAVFPVEKNKRPAKGTHGYKSATTDPETIKKWYENGGGTLGVAIATGLRSNLVVVDIDEHEAYTDGAGNLRKARHGVATMEQWEKEHGKLPKTPRVRSGNGGLHLYFATDENYSSTESKVGPDIDTRADGAYIVAPPSKNELGKAYTWEISPDEVEPPEVSGNVAELLRPTLKRDLADLEQQPYTVPEEIPEGQRTSAMIKLIGALYSIGMDSEAIKDAIRSENDRRCTPPLSEEELTREVFPALNRNWERGRSYIESAPREVRPLPAFTRPRILRDELPPLKPELIGGILRQGHKFQLSAPSKAGKSFLLIELAAAMATGTKWLGLPCRAGKVLYLNMEIDAASFDNRLYRVCEAARLDSAAVKDSIYLWHLRGYTRPLEELLEPLRQQTEAIRDQLEAVIIDPVYKLGLGDENSAEAVGAFCNQIDQLAESTGAAVIYAHHHSKGSQGRKSSIDRASGSGVFARDPDAIMSMSPLVKTDKEESEKTPTEQEAEDEIGIMGRKAFRCTFTLREFPERPTIDAFFDYPLHSVEGADILRSLPEEGSRESNLAKSSKRNSKRDRFPEIFDYLLKHPDKGYKDKEAKTPPDCVKIQRIGEMLEVTGRTVKNWIQTDYNTVYEIMDGGYCRKIHRS